MGTGFPGGSPVGTPPVPFAAIGYVALDVTDLARSRDFYTRVIGLTVTEEVPGTVYLRCRGEHHCLALHRADRAALRYVAFETRDDASGEALRVRLNAAGVEVRGAETAPGCLGTAMRFHDVEGTCFEVYRAQLRRAPVLAHDALPALKLGHATFRCSDSLAVGRFHRELVGFRVSDYSPGKWVFLRCNADHHALAFTDHKESLFHHLAFDVGNWEGIKLACDRLAREEWALEDGPMRHPDGDNLAAYLADPDGFHVEFYCEMEQILDDEDHARPDYQPFRNLWMRSGVPDGYHQMIPRDRHGKFLRREGDG